jgi:CheY-like chemotaxis protein
MTTDIQPIVLVIDDNDSDIALLETAWMHAGYDETIGICACTSYAQALTWLRDEIPCIHVISGVLVDLMLGDEAGISAVDRLSEMPILTNVPVISWIGGEFGQKFTDRMRKSTTRVWTKPSDWLGWSDFTRRFYNVLDGRSTPSRTGMTTA